MKKEIAVALENLRVLNPAVCTDPTVGKRKGRLQKVLVANRGEIARRFFFLLKEEGIPSVAVVTDVDRQQSWFEFANQVVYIGEARNYADPATIIAAAKLTGANAIYPGYGFLSEDFRFVEALEEANNETEFPLDEHEKSPSADSKMHPGFLNQDADVSSVTNDGLMFMGPGSKTMRRVSNKIDARRLARENGVALFEGSAILKDENHAKEEAERIGFPVILKLDAGGGGKGMFAVEHPSELSRALESARRIGQQNYGNSDCYLEKLVEVPVHIEVQIFNGHAIGIRKCAVQRRNQKIIEESGDAFLDHHTRLKLLAEAETMAHCSGYREGGGAGTVEFLLDANTGQFGFLEMNTRLQVEYPVTDQSLQIDLAKWQLLYYDGREIEIPYERVFRLRFAEKEHAIECRIYAEDPWNDFAPAPGRILELDLPTFNGVRCDFGFRQGDRVLPDYDPMIGKLIVRGKDRNEAISRLERALSELYVAGLTSNVDQLLAIVRHPSFVEGNYSNLILTQNEELQRMEEKDPVQAAVFAAVGDFESRLKRDLEETFRCQDLGDALERIQAQKLPRGYRVRMAGGAIPVDLLRKGTGVYYAYVNGTPYCELKVQNRLDSMDDLLVIRDGYSSPVRIDHRAGFRSIRIMERDRRIRYYRMQIEPVGTEAELDLPGTVRAPFAATFVQLGKDSNGNSLQPGIGVRKGDCLLVISAMKMECQIVADRDGTIEFLLENGEEDKLIKGKTADGLVLGRSISEGEQLFRVSGEDSPDEGKQNLLEATPPDYFSGPKELFLMEEPSIKAEEVLHLTGTLIHGYQQDGPVVDLLDASIQSGRQWNPDENEQKCLAALIQDFATLDLLFSPLKEKDQTYFGQLNRLIQNWDDPEYQPSLFFRSAAARMLRRYGLDANSGRTPEKRVALYHMIRARVQFPDIRRILVSLLKGLNDVSLNKEMQFALVRLQKQSSLTDTGLARCARALLRKVPLESSRSLDPGQLPISENQIQNYLQPEWPDFVRMEIERLLELDSVKEDLDQRDISGAEHSRYEQNWVRIDSGHRNVATYVHKQGKPGYCMVWLDDDSTNAESVLRDDTGIPDLERAARSASKALKKLQSDYPAVRWKLHILGHGQIAAMDFRSIHGYSQYESIMKVIRRLVVHYLPLPVDSVIADYLTREYSGSTKRRLFRISALNGQARLEMVPEEDPVHPNGSADIDDATRGLLEKGKWTPEIWARETFDPGTIREIRFPRLEAMLELDGENQKANLPNRLRRIGSRLFAGEMHNQDCLFYIKDSRVNGGATGNLEGQMYVASLHYAYLSDTPIYIWNDGAGANIKEGMIALNRAAEGFFFNALTSNRPKYDEYFRRCTEIQDPEIHELLSDVESMVESDGKIQPESFFLAAVGMGSSTGLDVYGSSQAPIQVMLDEPGSFRVLTGSNVIRSVTGEDLTNYEIGGAPVMGFTGTVDRIARDKSELILEIRKIHRLMRTAEKPEKEKSLSYSLPDSAALRNNGQTDSMFGSYVTHALLDFCTGGELISLKENYSAAGALGAWLGRIQGQPYLIMGPGEAGIRSIAAIHKARDLLRAADRLALPVILFFGKHWYRPGPETEATERIRARMDFLRTCANLRSSTYHMVLDPEGLNRVALNQNAEAIILVSPDKDPDIEAESPADFQESSIFSAFMRISEINALSAMRTGTPPELELQLPEASQPFDMKEILRGIVDSRTLMFWQDSRPEPNLITATARLNGKSIAIIADQPVRGGVPDARGTERFRQFVERIDVRGLPLLMLSNAPGFLPGTQQERLRIQQIGGESLDVNVLSSIPIVSVVLRQNYGGRQIHAFSRFLRPGIYSIALRDATMAVMGAEAAFELFKQKEYQKLLREERIHEARKLRSEYLDDYRARFRADQDALGSGALDEVVDAIDLRDSIIRGFDVAENRTARWKGDVFLKRKSIEPSYS
ncbi:MAG: carboxyl transferase domain-containing protein [Leptospiraceae bacterium]